MLPFKAAGADLETELRKVIGRDDDYAAVGKPVCDYDDPVARKVLVDALAKDPMGLLRVLDGRELDAPAAQAGCCWRPWSARTWTKAPMGCSG